MIGSLTEYQSVGAGSIPVASTTVLVSATRSIGNGQEICNGCAWESLEKSGLFPISRLITRYSFSIFNTLLFGHG